MNNPQPAHYSAFPRFYTHPLIQRLSTQTRWTVSGITDLERENGNVTAGKAPLCLLLLEEGKNVGAQNHDYWNMPREDKKFGACGTLQDVCEIAPCWPNVTYWLDSAIDQVFAVDIEPTCPDDIKQKFLQTNFIYGEVSMSGKGYHLFYNVRWEDFQKKYEFASLKDHIQEEHKYYEVHFNHWLTLTRRMIDPPAHPNRKFLLSLLTPLFEAAKKSTDNDMPEWKENLPIDDIPGATMIQRALMMLRPYEKTPEDFHGDMSKWEFGLIGDVYRNLLRIISRTPTLKANSYTQEQLLLILYSAVLDRIPHRPKHDTVRGDVPWLVYECQKSIAANMDWHDKLLGSNQKKSS